MIPRYCMIIRILTLNHTKSEQLIVGSNYRTESEETKIIQVYNNRVKLRQKEKYCFRR